VKIRCLAIMPARGACAVLARAARRALPREPGDGGPPEDRRSDLARRL